MSLIQLLSNDSLRKKPIPSTRVTAPMMASQFRPKTCSQSIRFRKANGSVGGCRVKDGPASATAAPSRIGMPGAEAVAASREGVRLSRSGGRVNASRASSASGAAGCDGTASAGAAGAGVASDDWSEVSGGSSVGWDAGAGGSTACCVSSALSSCARRAWRRSSRCEICSSWLSTAPSCERRACRSLSWLACWRSVAPHCMQYLKASELALPQLLQITSANLPPLTRKALAH